MRPGTKTTFSFLCVFLIVWLSLRYLLPLSLPFLLGLGLALAAEPMTVFLHKRIYLPRAVCAGIAVTLTFFCIALLLLLLCAFVIREMGIVAGILPDLEDTAKSGMSLLQNWLLNLTSYTPQSIQPLLNQNVTEFFSSGTALLNKGVRYILGLAGNFLTHVPDSALGLGTALISSFMISAKLPKIRRFIKRRLPREKIKPILDALKRTKDAAFGWLLAQLKLAAVTLSILMLGFILLRIPYAPIWALAISLVDAFPVLGTGTILIPWSLICFLQEDTPRAIGLIGIYVVVSLTRSVLEPRLLGKQLGLDPLVTLMVLYAGYKLWGLGGMILAPLLTVTALQLVPERNP